MRPLLALALLVPAVSAASPGFVPIQGLLTNTSGTPIDGSVDVQFQLYTASDGATELWQDTITVDVVNGRFATELGSDATLDLAVFASNRGVHLGITVAGDSQMPLVPLDTVPYAAWADEAGNAATLGGVSLGGVRAEIPQQSDIEATARVIAYDTEAELLAVLNDNYAAAGNVGWTELTGIPAGFSDDVDNDTTYDGTDFATSSQSCTSGVVTGIDAAGDVICAADADTQVTSVDGLAGGTISSALVVNGALSASSLDLGSGAHDDLTPADINALTAGAASDADGLHTHPSLQMPSGAVIPFNLASCPAGWTAYAPAYGRMIRGIDPGGTIDPDGVRAAGSLQGDEFKSHTHSTVQMIGNNAIDGVDSVTTNSGEHHNEARETGSTGGTETRSKNVALLFCEKN